MAGIRLWELYIRVPQDLVDDPKCNPSLNAMRLLLYLCRHSARLNKTVLRFSQDEILHGRKIKGVRVDGGAKLAGPRHLIAAREELTALGWLKYYNLEGAFVYELVIEEEQFPKGTGQSDDAGSQKEPEPVPKRNQVSSQKEPGSVPLRNYVYIEELQNKVTEQGNRRDQPSSPAKNHGVFHSALEGLKGASASQLEMQVIAQRDLLDARSGEGFNSIEVAHCMCVELVLAGQANKIMLDEALNNYRAKNKTKAWEQCGEDLLALWAEYDATVKGKFKKGIKSFFSDGVFMRRAEWCRNAPQPSGATPATDILAQRRQQLGAKGKEQ